jgi:hypothetical protein
MKTCSTVRSLAVALLSLVAVGSPANAQGEAEELQRARRQIKLYTEQGMRRGYDICLGLRTPEATMMMLEVLDWTGAYRLTAAHYRDVVWEGLLKVDDPYCQMSALGALKEYRSNPLARMWLVKLIGLWDEPDMGKAVLKALSDKDVYVARESARALGRMRYEPATKGLKKQAKNKDFILRSNSIEALARIDPEVGREQFEKGLADKHGGVRCALLGVALEVYPDDVVAWSTEALKDEDWRPRMQAVENLAQVRTKTAVDALVAAVEDGRPVVAVRASDELQSLTGMKWTQHKQWERWWGDQRAEFELPSGERKKDDSEAGGARDDRTVVYNGIPIVSDHVAFVIDKSRWMRDRLEHHGTTKDAAATAELERVLGLLEGRLVFNLYLYNEDIEVFAKNPAELNEKTRKRAMGFVEKARLQGTKDLWQVLDEVIADPEIDTIYMLSSGEPDVGLYVHGNRIAESLADLNRFQKVTLHAVAYSKEGFWPHIRQISEATGGQFEGFE